MANQVDTNPFESENASGKYSSTDEIYLLSAIEAIKLVNPVSENPEASILDIGAGTGIGSEELIKEGAKNITVLEPSSSMMAQAKERLGDKANYIEAKIEDVLELEDMVFDMAYALNCFHLFQDLSKSLANIACVIKNDGYFVFNISAPTYGFDELSEEELVIIQKNLEFYTKLSEKVQSPIIENTKDLLEKTLARNYEQIFDKQKITDLFKAINFDLCDYKESLIKISSDYQVNIWSMMASAFSQDQKMINEIIESIELSRQITIRQAIFKMQNRNS